MAARTSELMYEADGVGRAGPHVGLPWRMFVVAAREGETADHVFINPALNVTDPAIWAVRHRRYHEAVRVVRSINHLPEGSKVLLEELSVEPDVWIAINLEVEQTLARRMPRWRVRLFNAGTLAAFLAALGVAMLLRLPTWVAVPAAVLVLVLWIALMRWVHASTRRSIRWEVMARRGLPICAQCGYNLTALASARCPECGRALDERGTDEPCGRYSAESAGDAGCGSTVERGAG